LNEDPVIGCLFVRDVRFDPKDATQTRRAIRRTVDEA
jgi:hypothetical protein